jgi:hypothetical protein
VPYDLSNAGDASRGARQTLPSEEFFMSKTNPLSFRIEQEIKEGLVRAAKDDHRSISSLVEFVMRRWLMERGYLDDNRIAPGKATFAMHDEGSR